MTVGSQSSSAKVATSRLVLLAMATAALVTAQSAGSGPSPSFEVASVKVTAHGRNADGLSVSDLKIASPGRLVGTNTSLDECIRWAYSLKEYQISGPDWLNSDSASYDIEAKAPAATTPAEMRLMLQNLLRARFGLEFHWINKLRPVYLLVPAKDGPRLRPGDAGVAAGLTSFGGHDGVRVEGDNASMEALAHRLSADLDRPVFDKTGISGTYRIRLEWAREGDGPSVFSVIQERLGLKLESARVPIQTLVVDHAEKAPSAN